MGQRAVRPASSGAYPTVYLPTVPAACCRWGACCICGCTMHDVAHASQVDQAHCCTWTTSLCLGLMIREAVTLARQFARDKQSVS